MIETQINYNGFKYKQIYFGDNCNNLQNFSNYDIIRIYQSYDKCSYTNEFYTLITDLENDILDIRKKFTKSIKSEINKNIKKDNIRIQIITNPSIEDIDKIMIHYEKFVLLKELSNDFDYTKKSLSAISHNLVIFKAIYENIDIVYHSYIFDKQSKIVKLKTSASLRDNLDKEMMNLISRTNKRMHFEAIKYFKEDGFKIYDWGGVDYNMESSVSQFKKHFGGDLICFYEGLIFRNKVIKIKYLLGDIGFIGILKKIFNKIIR